jgi:uncharacterized membrane protein YgcG
MRVFVLRPRGDPSQILEFLQRIKTFSEPFTWLCRSQGGRKFPVAGVKMSPLGLARTPEGRFLGEKFVGVRPCAGDRIVFIGQESTKRLAYILAYADVVRSPEMCTPIPASLGDFGAFGAKMDQRVFLGNLKIRRPLILVDPEDTQLYYELFLSPSLGPGSSGGCLRTNIWMLLPPYDVGWEYLESLKVIPLGEDYGNSRARATPYDHTPRKKSAGGIESKDSSMSRVRDRDEKGDGEDDELSTPGRKLRKVSRGFGRGSIGRGGGRVRRASRGRGVRGGRGSRGGRGGRGRWAGTSPRMGDAMMPESEQEEMEEEEKEMNEMDQKKVKGEEEFGEEGENKGTAGSSSWFSSCTIQ